MILPFRIQNTECALLPDGYLAIYHPERRLSYVVPPMGAIVWELCDGEHSIDDMVLTVTELAHSHGTVPGSLFVDIENMLKSFADDGLVTFSERKD